MFITRAMQICADLHEVLHGFKCPGLSATSITQQSNVADTFDRKRPARCKRTMTARSSAHAGAKAEREPENHMEQRLNEHTNFRA